MLIRNAVFALVVGFACATSATAQDDYPNRPIVWVAPFPPGGITDTVARVVTPPMAEALGQSIIIENRAGAASAVGTEYAIQSKPDGYTLLHGANGNLATNMYIYKDVNYDPLETFEFVGSMTESIPVLVVNSNKPWKTVEELVAYAKENPGAVNYGSPGIGTGPHLAGVMFGKAAGIEMTHIPYQGSGPEMVDMVSGVLDIAFEFPAVVEPYIESGNFRPIANMGTRRLPTMQDVPTLVELGYEDGVMTTWSALVAPKGTPEAALDKLSAALETALQSPSVVEFFERTGSTIREPYLGREELREYVAEQNKVWKELVELAGISEK